MQHMTKSFHPRVKRGLASGYFREHCGDAITHKLLDHDTQETIYRSAARPKKSSALNHRLAPHGAEVSTSSGPSEDRITSGSPLQPSEGSSPKQKTPKVFMRSSDEENPSGSKPMPTFDPTNLIGRTFLLPPDENGERYRAKETRKVVEIIDQDNGHRVENMNSSLDIDNGKVEELISYNQLLEHLENAQDNDMGMDQEDMKVLWLHQIQIGNATNMMFKLNVRLGTSHMNPSPSLLLMMQLPGQHMPKKMIYLQQKDGIGSGTLQKKIKALHGQSSKVRSDKSGDPKLTFLGT